MKKTTGDAHFHQTYQSPAIETLIPYEHLWGIFRANVVDSYHEEFSEQVVNSYLDAARIMKQDIVILIGLWRGRN